MLMKEIPAMFYFADFTEGSIMWGYLMGPSVTWTKLFRYSFT